MLPERKPTRKKTQSIHLRLTLEEAALLNTLARNADTATTTYVRHLVTLHLTNQAAEMLVKVSPLENIFNRVIDARMKKLENRLAGLLVKGLLASLEAEGFALNGLKQVLNLQKLSEVDINRKMAIIKDTVYKSAKEKLIGKLD